MPWIVPALPAIAGAIGGITASKINSNASKRAATQQNDATNRALTMEQDNETYRRGEHDREESERKRQWDAEQKRQDEDRAEAAKARQIDQDILLAREQRRAPYRAASDAAMRSAAASIGLDLSQFQPMPATATTGTASTTQPMRQTPSAMSSMADAVRLTPAMQVPDPYMLAMDDTPMSDAVLASRRRPRYA